ncbi:MAG: hemerythrin domain-containing protein [Deltaproteobacteria bacterium]|nr:hemerythrin domain-containing protein [Deltaproteobacteria bacterium]
MVEEHRLILRMASVLEAEARGLEAGRPADWNFYLSAVDFIRNYADRFHHAKEEDILFRELVRNGMPTEHSPVAAMRMAHDQGRALVRGMEEAALRGREGDSSAAGTVVEKALGYVAFIREHIDTEDNILYPLAERVLPSDWRAGMLEEYDRAEAAAPAGFQRRYAELVERSEQKALAAA